MAKRNLFLAGKFQPKNYDSEADSKSQSDLVENFHPSLEMHHELRMVSCTIVPALAVDIQSCFYPVAYHQCRKRIGLSTLNNCAIIKLYSDVVPNIND